MTTLVCPACDKPFTACDPKWRMCYYCWLGAGEPERLEDIPTEFLLEVLRHHDIRLDKTTPQ